MSGPRVVLAVMGLAFCLMAPASARADSIHPQDILDCTRIDSGDFKLPVPISTYTFVEQFGNNNGRHLGFSVAAFHGGLRYTLVQPGPSQSAVIQNPEPASLILLGSGLVAVAAFARRTRRRRQQR